MQLGRIRLSRQAVRRRRAAAQGPRAALHGSPHRGGRMRHEAPTPERCRSSAAAADSPSARRRRPRAIERPAPRAARLRRRHGPRRSIRSRTPKRASSIERDRAARRDLPPDRKVLRLRGALTAGSSTTGSSPLVAEASARTRRARASRRLRSSRSASPAPTGSSSSSSLPPSRAGRPPPTLEEDGARASRSTRRGGCGRPSAARRAT